MPLSFARGSVQWLTSQTVGTTIVVTGLGFQPKALRFTWTGIQSNSPTNGFSTTLDMRSGVGFATGTADRRCVGIFADDNVATENAASIARNDSVVVTIDGAAATTGLLDLSAIGTDGFTLIVDDVTPANITVNWEAWGGTDITVQVVGDISEPAATGTQNYTVTGFAADGVDQVVMFAGCQSTAALNTGTNNDGAVMVGFATSTSGANQVVGVGNTDDGSSPTDTSSYARSGECLAMQVIGDGNPNARATLSAWGTNQFTLNWTARASTGRKYIYMAIKGGKWRAGVYTINGGTIGNTATVSGLPFQPEGISAFTIDLPESAAGTVSNDAIFTFGSARSTTDRGSISGIIDHAQDPSVIALAVEYDRFLVPLNPTAIKAEYDIDAINSDGFRVIVDVAGGNTAAAQFYLAAGNTFVGTPTPTPTITRTPTLTPTNTPTRSQTPTQTPSATVTPSLTEAANTCKIELVGTPTESTTTSITLPTGLQQNDLVIIVSASDGTAQTVPSTFTLGQQDTNTAPVSMWSYKFMGATPDTTATGLAGTSIHMAFAFRNVDTATPFDVASPTMSIGGAGMPNSPSITTVTARSMIVSIGFLDDDVVAATVTPPSGFSLIDAAEYGTAGAGATIMAASIIQNTAGTIDPGVFGSTGGDDAWVAATIALRFQCQATTTPTPTPSVTRTPTVTPSITPTTQPFVPFSYSGGSFDWLDTDALNSTIVISGLGFQPKALKFYWTGFYIAILDDVNAGIGFAASSTSRRSVGIFSQTNANPTNCGVAVVNTAVVVTVSGAGAITGQLDISSFDADGFTLIVDDPLPTGRNLTISWEAWGGSDITNVTIGDIAEPAATGTQNYTGVAGFTSDGVDQCVMFAGSQQTNAVNSPQATDAGMMFGWATSTDAEQKGVITTSYDDNVNPPRPNSYSSSGDTIAMIPIGPAVGAQNPNARATLSAWGTTQFTLNWLARATTNRRYFYMAIKGGKWRAGNALIDATTTGNTSTISSLPMNLKGLSFFTMSDDPSPAGTGAIDFGIWCLGNAKSTTSRQSQSYILDTDAGNNTTLNWDGTSAMAQIAYLGGGDGYDVVLDVSEMTSNSFTIIVDNLFNFNNLQYFYLAAGGAVESTTPTPTPTLTSTPTPTPTTAAIPGGVVADGLVLYLDPGNTTSYPGTGTLWNDLSLQNNDGTLVNTPQYLQYSYSGTFLFDGVTQYVDEGAPASLNTGLASYQVWVRNKTPSDALNHQIISRTNTNAGTFNLLKRSTNVWGVNLRTAATPGTQQLLDSVTAPTTSWTNLCVTYDGTTVRLYINGVQDNTLSVSGLIDTATLSAINIMRNTNNTAYFNGQLGVVLIYNKALSGAEITQNYNAFSLRYPFLGPQPQTIGHPFII